jgi:hypothetical protein
MSIFAGLDVSDKTTHICVVDDDGAILRRDVVASDPDVLAKWLVKHCDGLVRVVLETGPLSTFLCHGLTERSIPVECICARHTKGVLAIRCSVDRSMKPRTSCCAVCSGHLRSSNGVRRSQNRKVTSGLGSPSHAS